ncbi:hypothetical protein J2S70_001691 [Trueperella bonasi]|uniref:DUF2530 domain-containing protein n=1 Tax=Trueperella bonasi TaxID=312286 RepID=A0ABT9NI81_9ACTO|nr:hypothetical protein [Trueperella bonasi]MDP9807109.1 hypothetical protein [Trueperella bonasi]
MRDKDSGADWDAEWIELERKLAAEQGFRTWTPAAEEDEPFDPADLPDVEPVSPASQPDVARLLFLTTAAVIVVFILGWLNVIILHSRLWMVLGTIGFVSAAAGVYASAPWSHRPGDDGTRV